MSVVTNHPVLLPHLKFGEIGPGIVVSKPLDHLAALYCLDQHDNSSNERDTHLGDHGRSNRVSPLFELPDAFIGLIEP
jgi:hypothetical protein